MTVMRSMFDISTPSGRRTELGISVIVVLTLCALVAETAVDEDGTIHGLLITFELAIGVIFGIEYTLRVFTSERPLRYIFSFLGVIDLIAALSVFTPFLGSLKAFRIFRALRIFKLLRYSNALKRFSTAFDDIKDELAIYLCATGILTFIAAYGIYVFEHENNEHYSNLFECVYWSIASLTAGAEGIAPVTVGGKILTMVLVLIGLGVVAVPSGLLASALSRQDDSPDA